VDVARGTALGRRNRGIYVKMLTGSWAASTRYPSAALVAAAIERYELSSACPVFLLSLLSPDDLPSSGRLGQHHHRDSGGLAGATGRVTLRLYLDGNFEATIVSLLDAGITTYFWTIPVALAGGGTYSVRAQDADNGHDVYSDSFIITPGACAPGSARAPRFGLPPPSRGHWTSLTRETANAPRADRHMANGPH
jgi:hypothetical protein